MEIYAGTYPRPKSLEQWLEVFRRLDLRSSSQFALCGPFDILWPLIHALRPLFQRPLQRIIDDRIEFIRITLDQAKVQYTIDLLLYQVIFHLLLAIVALGVHLLLDVFYVLQRLLEIVLTSLPFMPTLFNKLECT